MTMRGAVVSPSRLSSLRSLAVLGALAMAFALLPQTAGAQSPEEPVEEPGPDAACPQEAPELTFGDRAQIPAAHLPNVRCAVAMGIVSGFPDGTYGPHLPVRRDQMAAFIALTLDAAGVDLPEGAPGTFTDVPATNTHARHVNRLAAVGIVQGGPSGLPAVQYGPGLRTRRDQMASFLMRAAGYALQNDVDYFNDFQQRFTDVPSTNAHFAKVNAAAAEGLAGGVGAGLYAPGRETRRDQLASFVVRLLNYVNDASSVDIVIEPASGAPGTQVSGTLSGETEAVEGISVSGPCVEDVADVTPTAGTFAFTIAPSAAQGACTITFRVAFNDGSGRRTLTRSFEVSESLPTPEVDVTITSTSHWPGSLVTASLSGETRRVREVAVSAPCVEDRAGAPDEDRLTFVVAEGAAAGSCTVSFAISFVDGSPTQTITRTLTLEPRPQVSLDLATSSSPPGTRITGTATGDLDKVQRIGVAGPCVQDQPELALANGSFALDIRREAAVGTCNIVFEVTFTDGGSVQPVTRQFQVSAPPPEAPVSITTSPLPGRHVTGAVGGDRSRIAQVRVSGPCIRTAYTLDLSPTGAFDFAVAPGTTAQACALSFVIDYNDGSPSQTIPRTYNVNALLNGPNLTHAVANLGARQVTYHFDQAVRLATGNECRPFLEDEGPRFSVITDKPDPNYSYFGTGVRRHPSNVALASGGTAVVATYPAGVVESAQLATIRNGAVIAGSRCSYASNAALPGHGNGTTAKPDLLSVSRSVTTSGPTVGNVVVYRFDQNVSNAGTNKYSAVFNSELFLADANNGLVRPLDDKAGPDGLPPSHPGLSPCTKQYTSDTITVTNCYTNLQVQQAVLGVTQPMPPRHMATPPPGPNYQPVNTDGITPSHPEAAATF